MLWGSKRTGPDLARVGGKYSDDWHAAHLINPRDVVPSSIMPSYPWLMRPLETRDLQPILATLAKLGTPYTEDMIRNAANDAIAQTRPDSDAAMALQERYGEDIAIRSFAGDPNRLTEMDAIVAYLQSIGTLTDETWEVMRAHEQMEGQEQGAMKLWPALRRHSAFSG